MHLFERRSLKQSHYVNYHMKIVLELPFSIQNNLFLIPLMSKNIHYLPIRYISELLTICKKKKLRKNHLLFLASIEGFSQIQHQHFQKKNILFLSSKFFIVQSKNFRSGNELTGFLINQSLPNYRERRLWREPSLSASQHRFQSAT